MTIASWIKLGLWLLGWALAAWRLDRWLDARYGRDASGADRDDDDTMGEALDRDLPTGGMLP